MVYCMTIAKSSYIHFNIYIDITFKEQRLRKLETRDALLRLRNT